MPEIDWDRCLQELEEQFPEIEKALKTGINSIKGNATKFLVSLENYPPHIAVEFFTKGQVEEEELMKSGPSIADVIGKVAEDYRLRPYKRSYIPSSKGQKKMWKRDTRDYTLNPDYKKYKVQSTA